MNYSNSEELNTTTCTKDDVLEADLDVMREEIAVLQLRVKCVNFLIIFIMIMNALHASWSH